MATGGINTDILSDETFDVLCTMCKDQGKNTEAEKFCVDCNDYFCLTCVKVHSQVPLLRRHKILDKGKFPSGSSKGQPMAPTERCNRHSHKHIDMYCQNHDNVGCSTCMAVDHRSCEDIFYIPEFIQNNTSQVAPREIQLKLETVDKTLTEHNKKFLQEKQHLLKRKSELLENIRRFRKEINDRLDELQQSSVNEIEGKFKALVGKIEEGMKQLQENKVSVNSAKDKLVSPSTNVSEVFVNVKMGENVASNAGKCMEENKRKEKVLDINFEGDGKILALLKEVNALGKVTETNIKMAENKPAVKTQQKNPLLQIKGKKSYCAKVQSDTETCNIVSACCMEDGTIILVDNNNNKLKLLDSSTYTVTDYCQLPTGMLPWQVCPINKQQVAVTLPVNSEVHFISLGSRMTTTNKIKTDFSCYGLAYMNNNLYISDSDTSVYIYTVSGRKLKQFSKDQSGQKLFSNIFSLAVSKDATKIYVADYDNGLIVLDNNGQVVGQFNGPQLQDACGCYLTETGSVLVAGYNSNNVLQFTSNGELIGQVLEDSGENAGIRAVCCNQQMSKMIISRYMKDNIEVYDI